MRVTCLERVYSPFLLGLFARFSFLFSLGEGLRPGQPWETVAGARASGCERAVRVGARGSAMYKGTNGKNTLAHDRLMCGETAPPSASPLPLKGPGVLFGERWPARVSGAIGVARGGHQVPSPADNGRGGQTREGCAEVFTMHNIAGKRGQNSICTSLGRGAGGLHPAWAAELQELLERWVGGKKI